MYIDDSSYTLEYESYCDDRFGDDDDTIVLSEDGAQDFCDMETRGIAWIVLNCVACFFGLVGALGSSTKLDRTNCDCVSHEFAPIWQIVATLCVVVAVLIWEIDNPAYDQEDDLEPGTSIWIAVAAALCCVIAAGLAHAYRKLVQKERRENMQANIV